MAADVSRLNHWFGPAFRSGNRSRSKRARSPRPSSGRGDGVSDDYVRVRRSSMLWTIALVLLVLWAAGLVSSVTMGGFVHLLLVAAVVLVLVRLIQGRRVV